MLYYTENRDFLSLLEEEHSEHGNAEQKKSDMDFPLCLYFHHTVRCRAFNKRENCYANRAERLHEIAEKSRQLCA